MGGGALTEIAPGQEVTVRFKAIKAGTFIYHCAPGGVMIPWHVVSGMNGAITILPKDADGNRIIYDKAYFIGGQDFYLPKYKIQNTKYKIQKRKVSTLSITNCWYG